jgi:hypothetical protein
VSATLLRAIWWVFLAAVFVSLLALLGASALLDHAVWASAVRLACAALIVPLGLVVVRNWIEARAILVERILATSQRHHSRTTMTSLPRHLLNLALVMLGLVWIALGTFNLAQGLADLL